jgi:hypothetical protein
VVSDQPFDNTGGGGDGESAGQSEDTNTVTFGPAETGTLHYLVEVSGSISGADVTGFRPEPQQDLIGEKVAYGTVTGGRDRYVYTGEIVSMMANVDADSLNAKTNGESVDPSGLNYSQADEPSKVRDAFSQKNSQNQGLWNAIPGLLPGIGPLSSRQTTVLAGIALVVGLGVLSR